MLGNKEEYFTVDGVDYGPGRQPGGNIMNSPANPPVECRFHTRCWKAQEICSVDEPMLIARPDGESSHESACHFAEPRVVV